MSTFERNLTALQGWTSETATLLVMTALPAGFERVAGTDGSPTFRRLVEEGGQRRVEWLGGTSMPRASAESLVTGLDPGAGVGLGLSIGSGLEWGAFAAKLSPAHAVYVYESDVAALRLALEVADLAGVLAAGKVLLFSGDAAAASAALSAFLEAHPGYEAPTVLQPLPTLVAQRRNDFLLAGEAMVRRVVLERQALHQALIAQVENSLNTPEERLAAWLLTPRYPGERPLHDLCADRVPTLVLDRHTSTSMAARLMFLAAHRPGKLVSDLTRAQLGCVPHTVAVETWVPPLVGPAYWERLPPPATVHPQDRFVVHGGLQAERLAAMGFPAASTVVRPLPAGPNLSAATANAAAGRVAIFADLGSRDPDKLGIVLPTHLVVFEAASQIIGGEYLEVHEGVAEDVLRRALDRAGVQRSAEGAADPALREPMLRVIRDILIPTLVPLTLAGELAAQGVPLALLGDWAEFEVPAGSDVELWPLAGMSWGDVACIVDVSPTGVPSPLLWQAVAAGVAVVSPRQPVEKHAGSIASLLQPDVAFAHPARQQLMNTVKNLLREPARRQSLAAAAQSNLEKHRQAQGLD